MTDVGASPLQARDEVARKMTIAANDAVPGGLTLTLAMESLDVACRALDEAVMALPSVRGDDVMATPSLVALLLRVVVARRQVSRLELDVKAELRNQLRDSTVS
jgi:hypothetical protein